MSERAVPPDDISPREFFTKWVPSAVSGDESRRRRLGETDAVIEFELTGPDGGFFLIEIAGGIVSGREGRAEKPDLAVRLDVETWRALNRGELAAPTALLQRRVHLSGSLILALKLHLILG
jgi:putative sterol carrier protein